MGSVISKSLKITGELESSEDIQIDGQIEGDVRGVGVKIGQNAKVKGTVYGEEVELSGTVEGKIEAKKVFISGTARMTAMTSGVQSPLSLLLIAPRFTLQVGSEA